VKSRIADWFKRGFGSRVPSLTCSEKLPKRGAKCSFLKTSRRNLPNPRKSRTV